MAHGLDKLRAALTKSLRPRADRGARINGLEAFLQRTEISQYTAHSITLPFTRLVRSFDRRIAGLPSGPESSACCGFASTSSSPTSCDFTSSSSTVIFSTVSFVNSDFSSTLSSVLAIECTHTQFLGLGPHRAARDRFDVYDHAWRKTGGGHIKFLRVIDTYR